MSAAITLILSMLGSELGSALLMRFLGVRASRIKALISLILRAQSILRTIKGKSVWERLSAEDRKAVEEFERDASSAQRWGNGGGAW